MSKQTFTRKEVQELLHSLNLIEIYISPFGADGVIKNWEVAKEKENPKEYPTGILSIETNIGGVEYETAIKIFPTVSYQEWCRSSLEDYHGKIKSVRNSSGEIFAVGDNTDHGKIESFSVYEIFLMCTTRADVDERIKRETMPIDDVHPIKTFTTEDQKEITFGRYYFLAGKGQGCQANNGQFSNNEGIERAMKDWYIFESVDRRNEYIEMNKKVYSKQEILDSMIQSPLSAKHTTWVDMDKLGL